MSEISIIKNGTLNKDNTVYVKQDKCSTTIGIRKNGWTTNCSDINEEIAEMAIEALTEYLEIKNKRRIK